MTILSIDTATKVCSAALWKDGEVIAQRLNQGDGNHSRLLPVYLDELLQLAREHNLHLDAVALSDGPGSYTGLRIGAGTAKGLCYALDIPLVPISTTEVLCAAALAQQKIETDVALCPLIDARRMEVYAAYYTHDISPVTEIHAIVVESAESLTKPVQAYAKRVLYFGDGADKCREILNGAQDIECKVVSDIVPDAKYMGELAAKRLNEHSVSGKELAYYEPFYLKEFVAAPSHVKGLR